MSKLYICSTDYLNGFHNFIRLFLKSLLTFLRNGEHRRGTEGIPCMDTKRIDILDKAYGYNIVVRVTDNLKLQFFPAQNGLFNQNLPHQTRLQASCTDCLQFFLIINQTATGTAHRISRAQNHRISKLIGNSKCFLHRVSHLASRHFNSQLIHGFLKLYTVLATLNGIYLNTDDLDAVFVQNSCLI